MKKIVFVLFIISVVILINGKPSDINPSEMIRYRIIANSNKKEDQKLKWDVNRNIIPILSDIEHNSSSIEETRANITKKIPAIKQNIDSMNIKNNINFGYNYFPKKEYNNYVFEAGEYESLVITLGDGLGENWWCILFPPLCLLEATFEENPNIEYDFYFKKIINNYL